MCLINFLQANLIREIDFIFVKYFHTFLIQQLQGVKNTNHALFFYPNSIFPSCTIIPHALWETTSSNTLENKKSQRKKQRHVQLSIPSHIHTHTKPFQTTTITHPINRPITIISFSSPRTAFHEHSFAFSPAQPIETWGRCACKSAKKNNGNAFLLTRGILICFCYDLCKRTGCRSSFP